MVQQFFAREDRPVRCPPVGKESSPGRTRGPKLQVLDFRFALCAFKFRRNHFDLRTHERSNRRNENDFTRYIFVKLGFCGLITRTTRPRVKRPRIF